MRKVFSAAALAAFLVTGGLLATGAQASTVTGVMPVTATTLASCAVAALPLAFGTVNQINGTASDSQTNVVVTCTPGIAYEVGMDLGTHSSGSTRYMKAATSSAVIPYALYSNPSRTTAWGNTVGSDTVTGTAALLPTTLQVYGRIPADAPMVAAGVYADVVTVTVTF